MIKHINCRRIYLSMKSTCHNICIIVYISLMKESCTAEFTLWLRVLRHYYIYKIDLSNWPTSITNSSWDSKFELTLWKLILLVGSWLCWKYGKTEICLWQQSPKAAGVGGRQFSNSSGGVHAEKWKKKSFQVVLIPPLEGVVVQATLEGFGVLTAGFIVIELDLIPGEKHDKRMKTQNIT